jgi:hypothetical protein
VEHRPAVGIGVHDDGVVSVLEDGAEGVDNGLGGSEHTIVCSTVDNKSGGRPSPEDYCGSNR